MRWPARVRTATGRVMELPLIPDSPAGGKPPSGSAAVPATSYPDFWTFAEGECEEIATSSPEWSAVFDMARAVRGHPHADRYKPLTVARRLFARCPAIDAIRLEEDFLTEFSRCWKKVRLLPGTNPLESAMRFAGEAPLRLRPDHEEDATPGYVRFISFAGHLCVVVGSDRIKLPCREVAAALGVRPNTVSCYRQLAIEQGYLILLNEHTYNPKGKGEATEFRFRVNLWQYLLERMPKDWAPP